MSQKLVDPQPIGGYHGITVQLPSVQMNIDYEEGKIKLRRGYSRLLAHPEVRRLEQEYTERYQANETFAFFSPECALFVLMDALFKKGSQGFHFKGDVFLPTYKFLMQTAGNIVAETSQIKASVIFIDLSESYAIPAAADKLRIGFDVRRTLPPASSKSLDALILAHPAENAGFIVCFNPAVTELIAGLRRHTGFNLNSRTAERINQQKRFTLPNQIDSLKRNLAQLEKTEPEQVFLYPTGMGAISAAVLTALSPERSKLVMIGSPYTDTRSLLEKWHWRRGSTPSVFLEVDDYQGMQRAIDDETALVLCEIPTNPLLRIPDLEKVVHLAHQTGAQVMVDNTIATPYNLNPFDYDADFIVHSTTKFLNGLNDHIGGALLLRETSQISRIVAFNSMLNIDMAPDDAFILHRNLTHFGDRMEKINHNALVLAQYLENQPKVKCVHFPGLASHPDHAVAKKYLRGFSGLMSFELAGDIEKTTRAFYDHLGDPILKGPSLGSEQSLICLYTILAHYDDPPEKLARMGLNLFLLRISVGIEAIDEIINAFEVAFSKI
ncbi:PLP-dependent transferase [candidate division KSB1 bacterium]|nr:PLP-dependent transferase [candidate division KSB1 bacterium]